MNLKISFLLLTLVLMPFQLLALDAPQLTGRINDHAGMLSPASAARLDSELAAFERDQSTQIVVLTIPSLEGDDMEQFAIKVAEQWKIGQEGKDNGVILILSQAERRVRIEVGMGLQGVLPDLTAGRIIRDVMRPYLRNGDFDSGISAGVEAIMAATEREVTRQAAGKDRHPPWRIFTFFYCAALRRCGCGRARLLFPPAGRSSRCRRAATGRRHGISRTRIDLPAHTGGSRDGGRHLFEYSFRPRQQWWPRWRGLLLGRRRRLWRRWIRWWWIFRRWRRLRRRRRIRQLVITMTIKNYAILSPEQELAVQEAVSRAESSTSGEIVPMLVHCSDEYREAACQAATIIATTLSLSLALAFRDTSIWFFLPVAFLFYFPTLAVVRRLPRLKLAFTPAARISDIVRDRAIFAFYEEGLHRTREHNGILIFISMIEHKVWILGDHAINAVIPAERWISLASRLSSGIRQGTMTQSLTEVIAEVGSILQQHFPSRSDDTNELPDLIRARGLDPQQN